jgi:hypothetical protein
MCQTKRLQGRQFKQAMNVLCSLEQASMIGMPMSLQLMVSPSAQA